MGKKKRSKSKSKNRESMEIMESMDFNNPSLINVESPDYSRWLSDVAGSFRFASILSQIKTESKFVVQIPEQFQIDFQTGKLHLTQNSRTGKLWPSLYRLLPDGRHEFVANLPVVEETYVQGNPLQDITVNFQTMMLQRQLSAINKQLNSIDKTVNRIEQGQYDDRIAELKSGFEALEFALENRDENARKQELIIAQRDIRTAQNKFLQTIKSLLNNYEPIPENRLAFLWKNRKQEYYDQHLKEYLIIQDYWFYYVDATKLLAGSYEITGDKERSQKVIDNALNDIAKLNFDNISTFSFFNPDRKYFFDKPAKKMENESRIFLQSIPKSDCLRIELSGDKLLKEINHE